MYNLKNLISTVETLLRRFEVVNNSSNTFLNNKLEMSNNLTSNKGKLVQIWVLTYRLLNLQLNVLISSVLSPWEFFRQRKRVLKNYRFMFGTNKQ